MPDNVSEIGKGAFANCDKLQSNTTEKCRKYRRRILLLCELGEYRNTRELRGVLKLIFKIYLSV